MDPFTDLLVVEDSKLKIKTLIELKPDDYIYSYPEPVKIINIKLERGDGIMLKQKIGDPQIFSKNIKLQKNISIINSDKHFYISKEKIKLPEQKINYEVYRKGLKGEIENIDMIYWSSLFAGILDSSDYNSGIFELKLEKSRDLFLIARSLGFMITEKKEKVYTTGDVSKIPVLLPKKGLETPEKHIVEYKNIGEIDYFELTLEKTGYIVLSDLTKVWL